MVNLPDWRYCPDWHCRYDEDGCNRNCDDCNVDKERKCSTCDLFHSCYPEE